MAKQVEKAFHDSVEDFYEDYAPTRYNRTYSLFDAYNKGHLYHPNRRHGWSIVLEYNANRVKGEPHAKTKHGWKIPDVNVVQGEKFSMDRFIDKEYLLGMAWFHGSHGWYNESNGDYQTVLTTSPSDLMQNRLEQIKGNVGQIFGKYFQNTFFN